MKTQSHQVGAYICTCIYTHRTCIHISATSNALYRRSKGNILQSCLFSVQGLSHQPRDHQGEGVGDEVGEVLAVAEVGAAVES